MNIFLALNFILDGIPPVKNLCHHFIGYLWTIVNTFSCDFSLNLPPVHRAFDKIDKF